MTLHKKLKRGKISLGRFLLKVFLSRGFCHSFLLQHWTASVILFCAAGMLDSSDKSEQFQPLFDLGGSFISCNTHSAESCSTRLSSRFEFQVRHLQNFLKSPTKDSKDSKIPIFHFHC